MRSVPEENPIEQRFLAVPIAALVGIPLGTALAFMMSIAGLSLPEAIMLKKVMTVKLLAIFFGMVAAGIILIGYLFNLIS